MTAPPISRRSLIKSGGALGLGVAVPGITSQTAGAATPSLRDPRDAQLDDILARLEQLPEHLKNADPRTYPNYLQELEAHLAGVTVIAPIATQQGPRTASPQFSTWGCISSLAGIVASTGFPALKIIGWIKKARALYGGIKGIIYAIRIGQAAIEIGAEAAAVLGQITGVSSVVKNCFQ